MFIADHHVRKEDGSHRRSVPIIGGNKAKPMKSVLLRQMAFLDVGVQDSHATVSDNSNDSKNGDFALLNSRP